MATVTVPIGFKFDRKTKSLVHMLDPVTKILLLVIFMGFILYSRLLIEHIFIFMVSLFYAKFLGRIPWRRLWGLWRYVLLLSLPLMIGYPIFFSVSRYGIIQFTSTGLIFGFEIANRFWTTAMVAGALVWSTNPRDLSQSLDESLHRVLGELSYKIAFGFGLALVVFPVVEDESRKILFSLKLRGARMGAFSRILTFRKYLFSLLARLFRRIDTITLAMESKGFGAEPTRTYLHTLHKPQRIGLIRAIFIIAPILYILFQVIAFGAVAILYPLQMGVMMGQTSSFLAPGQEPSVLFSIWYTTLPETVIVLALLMIIVGFIAIGTIYERASSKNWK
jgi:energy-coupling factor transport system permease protein